MNDGDFDDEASFEDDDLDDEGGHGAGGGRWAAMTPGARRGVIITTVVVVLLIGLGAYALFRPNDEEEEPPAPTTTTTEPVTTTTEPERDPVAPLTGLPIEDDLILKRPAIAVKIDNLDSDSDRNTAVPQAGLPLADVVFEELVEGHITRFVAVFHSTDPGDRVGPVRSARTTDLHIIPQFGRTLFAWSGGNEGVTAAVAEVEELVDQGHGHQPEAYTRDDARRAPHNLYVDAGSLWAHAQEEVVPPEAIFEYRDEDDDDPDTAEPAERVELTWGGGLSSSPVAWTWDADLELYVREQRGRPHVDEDDEPITATNVVVLVTEYIPSPADPRSPEAVTLGTGRVLVLTNGQVIRGRWDREDVHDPAVLVDEDERPILLTPGRTWIELPREGEISVD